VRTSPTVRLQHVGPHEAEALTTGARPTGNAVAWHPEYPLDDDVSACGGYADRAGSQQHQEPFGYYYIVITAGGRETVVGGAGFHGPPILDTVEVGYSVVPALRGQGVATAALELLLQIAADAGVDLVLGSANRANPASHAVMLGAGMRPAGEDPALLYFDWQRT